MTAVYMENINHVLRDHPTGFTLVDFSLLSLCQEVGGGRGGGGACRSQVDFPTARVQGEVQGNMGGGESQIVASTGQGHPGELP